VIDRGLAYEALRRQHRQRSAIGSSAQQWIGNRHIAEAQIRAALIVSML
jgi:hypothetical protein